MAIKNKNENFNNSTLKFSNIDFMQEKFSEFFQYSVFQKTDKHVTKKYLTLLRQREGTLPE